MGLFGQVSLPAPAVPGDRARFAVVVANNGSAPAVGRSGVRLYASADAALDDGDILLASLTNQYVNLQPGRSRTFYVNTVVSPRLTPGQYHFLAEIDPLGQIDEADEGNNLAVTAAAYDVVWKFGNFEGRRNVRLRLDDAGTTVTFSLIGPGYGQVQDGAGDGLDLLSFTDTEPTSSAAVRTTPGTSGTRIDEITVDGSLRRLDASAADLTGDLTVAGTLAWLRLGDVIGPSTISIGASADPRAAAAMTFDRVSDLTIRSGIAVRSVTATEWLDADGVADVIQAPSLARLNVRGDRRRGISGNFQADLDLAGSAESRVRSLGSARIAGDLSAAQWYIDGDVGSITVAGDVTDWLLDVDRAGADQPVSLRSLRAGVVHSADVSVHGLIGSVRVVAGDGGGLTAESVRSLAAAGDRRSGIAGDFAAAMTLTGPADPRARALGSCRIAGSITGTAGSPIVWDIDGRVGTVSVSGAVGHWRLLSNLGQLEGARYLRLGAVNDVEMIVNGQIGTIQVLSWSGGSISARALRSLNVSGSRRDGIAGDFVADLSLTGIEGSRLPTLGSVRVAGDLGASAWNVNGPVGSVTVLGDVDGWVLDADRVQAGTPMSVRSLRLGRVVSADVIVTDGIFTLSAIAWQDGSITAASLRSLDVRGWRRDGIAGDFAADLDLTDAAARLTLGSARVAGDIAGGTWTVAGSAGVVSAGSVSAGWTGQFDGDLRALRVSGDAAGTLSARSIGSLTVRGNLHDAHVTLTQAVDPDAPRARALGRLTVTGWVNSTQLRCSGHIGAVTAGGFRDSDLFAGVVAGVGDLPGARDDFEALPFEQLPAIATVTVRGLRDEPAAFINSNVAAWSIGRITLRDAQIDNGGVAFGFACNSLRSLTYRTDGATYRWPNRDEPLAPSSRGDLTFRMIAP